MHVSDGGGAVKGFSGTAVAQLHLTGTADGHALPETAVL